MAKQLSTGLVSLPVVVAELDLVKIRPNYVPE